MFIAIGALAAVVVAILVVREIRRSKQTHPIRDELAGQPIRFQTSVRFKRDPAPKWALGAAGFTLLVRPGTLAVLGPGESQSLYFSAADSTVEWCESGRRDWIVIAGTDSGNPVGVWIRPTDRTRLWDAWSALVLEGAAPLSEPPLPS
jgi:hypothetical protein